MVCWRALSLRSLLAFGLVVCCLCSAPAEAFAEVDPASVVFSALVGRALNSNMAYDSVVDDLAKRWFAADATKKDKLPVRNYFAEVDDPIYPNNYPQLTDFSGYWDWKIGGVLADLNYPNRLASFDSGTMIKEGSPALEIEYKKWYEYFEGEEQTSTGGSVTDDGIWITVTNSNRIDSVMGSSTARYGNINVDSAKWYISDISSLNNLTDFSLRLPAAMFDGMDYGYMFLQVAASGNGNGNPQVEMVLSEQMPTLNLSQNGTIASLVVSGGYAHWLTGRLEQVTKSVSGGTLRIDFGSVTPNTTSLTGSTLYPATGNYGSMYYLGSMDNTGGGVVVPIDPVPAPEPTYPGPVTVTPPTEPTNGVVSNPVVTDLEEFQNWLDQALSTYFGDVINWLKYIAEWEETISGQIYDFEENAIDLWRETNAWLRKIYYKWTGGSGPNIDPVSNPDDSLTWWERLLEWIVSLLPDELANLVSLLSTLNRHFPFSIPADVGFILGLLSEQPVTPEFDVVLNFRNAGMHWTWHVDLHPYDSVAYVFRNACELWFAMVLMTWTPSVIKQTTSII